MSALILVTSHGLGADSVSSFFNSLVSVNYTGYVGLISNDIRVEANVPFTVIHYPWRETEYFRSSSRLFLYKEFLQKHQIKFDKIILTGIRDVIFQKDPSTVPNGELDVFFEDFSNTIGRCPYNRRWIMNSYGWGNVERLQEKPVICAEIVVGSHEGMARFLDKMIGEAEKHERKHDLEDQAMLNFLYHTGELDWVRVVGNEFSYVYTVGCVSPILVDRHRIVNKAHQIPHIVHQYDRHVSLP